MIKVIEMNINPITQSMDRLSMYDVLTFSNDRTDRRTCRLTDLYKQRPTLNYRDDILSKSVSRSNPTWMKFIKNWSNLLRQQSPPYMIFYTSPSHWLVSMRIGMDASFPSSYTLIYFTLYPPHKYSEYDREKKCSCFCKQ